MRQYSVFTNEYDADIAKLLKKRLCGSESDSEESKNIGKRIVRRNSESRGDDEQAHDSVIFDIDADSDDELEVFCSALAEMMVHDLRYFELADAVERLPLTIANKKSVLMRALELTEICPGDESLLTGLISYLENNNSLNLEGYIHFRLRDIMDFWTAAADAAADELLEASALNGLMGLLGLLTMFDCEASEDIVVLLNPDGSCTITGGCGADSSEVAHPFRIDCAPNSDDGILSLISGMRPGSVMLYDMSFGKCEKLKNAIRSLFMPNWDDE